MIKSFLAGFAFVMGLSSSAFAQPTVDCAPGGAAPKTADPARHEAGAVAIMTAPYDVASGLEAGPFG